MSVNNGIVLPRLRLPADRNLYLTASRAQPMTDKILGFDHIARAALEVNRASYNPLPAGSGNEYAAFFCQKNYDYLFAKARDLAKNQPDSGELFEAMLWAYSSVQPRGDETDERRELYGADVTQSYVNEMNRHVIERVVAEIVAANKQWDHMAKYRGGPVDMVDDEFYVDTRTRFQSSRVDMTHYLP